MRYIFRISKMAVLVNCLSFLVYYAIQFSIIIGCIIVDAQELALTLHEVPFIEYTREIESGITLAFSGTTSLGQLFTIPFIVLFLLAVLNLSFIFLTNKMEYERIESPSLIFMFLVFIIIFFFDKRAFIGLIGTMGLIFIAKVREKQLTTMGEYLCLVGRMSFLVGTALVLGNLSYELSFSLFNRGVSQLFLHASPIDEVAHQVMPPKIVSTLTYILGTSVFCLGLLTNWWITQSKRVKFLYANRINSVFLVGMIVILVKPFFGSFFLLSALCFRMAAEEYGTISQQSTVFTQLHAFFARQSQGQPTIMEKIEMN